MSEQVTGSGLRSNSSADDAAVRGPHFAAQRNAANSAGAMAAQDDASLPQDEVARRDEVNSDLAREVLVTVLMPCLNESRTLAGCIREARAGCEAALADRRGSAQPSEAAVSQGDRGESVQRPRVEPGYEILVADNGSTDGSPQIAIENGARVVAVEERGYGAALRGGIAAARGKYIVVADADGSYNFGDIPRFVEKLEEGYDLVVGNRFAGGIEPGAMPWHHRYIGNPILSGLGRLLYGTPVRDWHCGLRGFDRQKVQQLGLRSSGMEFASEMILRAARSGLRMAEIPTRLRPDGRDRPPHLRSIRDGLRHVRVLMWANVTLRRISIWLAPALIALTCLVLFLFHRWPFESWGAALAALQGERVYVQPDSLRHSDVENAYIVPIRVSNLTYFPVRLLGAQVDCKCTYADEFPLMIAPRSTQVVHFTVRVNSNSEDTYRQIRIFLESGESVPIVIRIPAINGQTNHSK